MRLDLPDSYPLKRQCTSRDMISRTVGILWYWAVLCRHLIHTHALACIGSLVGVSMNIHAYVASCRFAFKQV